MVGYVRELWIDAEERQAQISALVKAFRERVLAIKPDLTESDIENLLRAGLSEAS